MNRAELLADATTRASNDHLATILFPLWCAMVAVVILVIFWDEPGPQVSDNRRGVVIAVAMLVMATGLAGMFLLGFG